jgi:hypothetical protein
VDLTPVNSTIATEIADIQRRMAQIRLEMHQDVQGAVRGAQSLTDWRSVVRSHPWLAIGTAVAAGYLIVPHRRREIHTVLAPSAARVHDAPASSPIQPADIRRAGTGTIGTIFSLLAPVAVRAAQNYALKQFELWLEHHPLHPARTVPGRPQHTDASAPGSPTGLSARFRDSR